MQNGFFGFRLEYDEILTGAVLSFRLVIVLVVDA